MLYKLKFKLVIEEILPVLKESVDSVEALYIDHGMFIYLGIRVSQGYGTYHCPLSTAPPLAVILVHVVSLTAYGIS
jgi:hypothetical protein